VRNQRLNAPQLSHQLEPGGSGLGSNAHLPVDGVGDAAGRWWGTSGLGDVAGREAAMKDYGVVAAMLQGHSWMPILSNGSGSERGNRLGGPGPSSIPVGRRGRRIACRCCRGGAEDL
jgi:hypothetical protein